MVARSTCVPFGSWAIPIEGSFLDVGLQGERPELVFYTSLDLRMLPNRRPRSRSMDVLISSSVVRDGGTAIASSADPFAC